jgi:hypothetical protein
LRAEFSLARALEHAGELEGALNGYSNLYERVVARLPFDWAREELRIMGTFFTNQKRFNLAQGVLDALCKSYEANPPKNITDFETFLRTTAMKRDWPAAVGLCLKYFDLFANGREVCRDVVRSFVQERRANEARVLYDCLRESLSARNPIRSEDMDLLIESDTLIKTLEAAL